MDKVATPTPPPGMSQLEHNISNAVTEPYLRLHNDEAVVHLPHNDDANAKEAQDDTSIQSAQQKQSV